MTAEDLPTERPAPRVGEALMTAARSAFDRVRRFSRMRRALQELSRLDDRMLDDIGLSRCLMQASASDARGFGASGHGGR
ncbi:DUF1127 domain-containing protein [Tepidamorphus gemmatus]|uniref:DUF1127 domain-containing protein n=1 Tax=Tepidamorphus gemmatus TaxID=747076 RepID=UPI001FE14530|nr:DUF1127 domain-containing protein [Tepidamorphus gemmatus]